MAGPSRVQGASASSGQQRSGAHEGRAVGRPHVPLAFGYGAVAALASLIVLMVPVFTAWTVDAQSSSSWNDTLGVAIDLWALAHRGHVAVDGTHLVFSPLLLTLGCVLAARFGARAAFPDERLRASDLRAIGLAYLGGYLAAAQVLGVLASLGHSHVAWWSLIVGPLVVALLGVAWTAWHERAHSPELAALDEVVLDATPLLMRRSLRAARRGLLLFVALAFALVVALVAWHGQRVWQVHQQLHPGIVGGGLLVLAQVLALPNLVGLASAWMTGASVSVGQVSLGHGGMSPGTLPMIPALGALPDAIAPWTWIALIVPVAVGALIGWDAAGSLTRLAGLRSRLIVAACASGVAVVALWLLWWFSCASVSDGLLGFVGPSWQAWAVVPVLLLVPALLTAALRHWLLGHRQDRLATSDAA